MPRPRAIVIRAPGTNCDEETADAWQRAGAAVEISHVNRLIEAPADPSIVSRNPDHSRRLFLYGDDLGAGRILATRIGIVLGDALRRFHDRGGLILGICNGFQVLVRSGLLPGGPLPCPTTLAHNDSGRFEARWVTLLPRPGHSPFVSFAEPIELPVAHGEGKFLTSEPVLLDRLEGSGQIVLFYSDLAGRPTQNYPANPNGSAGSVAGACDPTGRIFGLMPHPERFIDPWQHPRWTRRGPNQYPEGDGLRIFRSAIESLRS